MEAETTTTNTLEEAPVMTMSERNESRNVTGLPGSGTFLTEHTIHMAMGVCLVLIGIVGVLGNGLVLYVFSRYEQ